MKKTIYNVDWTAEFPNENAAWVLPQLLALLGTKLRLARNDEGLYSATKSLALWSDQALGSELILENGPVTRALTRAELGKILNSLISLRGGLLPPKATQISPEWSRYSAAVPLVLSAFKEYRNIPYSDWDWTDPKLSYFVDQPILETVRYSEYEEYSNEELLEMRDKARLIASGARKGTMRSIQATTIAYGGVLPKYPRLAKLMYLQLWLFHPSIRNKYMICDPVNLDSMPEPLIDGEVLALRDCSKPSREKLDPEAIWD